MSLLGGFVARLNIEDSLFKELGFSKLTIKLGSRREALGALVEAFLLAQKHFGSIENNRLIPLSEWENEEIAKEIIECGFATINEKGVYVRGSDEQFAWLIQKSEAGKSKSPAKLEQLAAARRSKSNKSSERKLNGSERDRTELNGSERDRTELNGSEPLTPTLPLPLTPTLPLSQTPIGKKAKLPSGKTLGSRIFEAYSSAYESLYGAAPIRDAKANSLCAQLGGCLGEEGPDVAKYYLEHKKFNYIQALHPLTYFLQDAAALRTQWFTGEAMTASKAKSGERTQQSFGAFSKHIGVKKP